MGASSIEQWTTSGHGVAWWCTVVCGTVLGSRSVLHHIESSWGVTDAWTQLGHETVQGEQSGDSMGDALGDETLVTILP